MNKYFLIDDIPFVLHNNYAYCLFPQNINKKLKCPPGIFFLRYISNFDVEKLEEWYYIIKDKREDLNAYSSNTRNQINKGLINNEIKHETDVKKIYGIYSIVHRSYNTNVISFEQFQEYFNNDFSFREHKIEYWIVYNSDIPIGFAKVAIQNQNMAFYEEIHIIESYKKTYASYALIHKMNIYYLNECVFNFVTDGSRNLLHNTNIQEFLINKFQFRKAYCKLQIEYTFWLKIFVHSFYRIRKYIPLTKKVSFLMTLLSLLNQEAIRQGKT